MALEQYRVGQCLAFMQMDVPDGVTIGGYPAPEGCESMLVQVTGAGIRVRMDGNAPTAQVGHLVDSGTSLLLRLPPDAFPKAYFVCANTDGVSTLAVHFFAAPV